MRIKRKKKRISKNIFFALSVGFGEDFFCFAVGRGETNNFPPLKAMA